MDEQSDETEKREKRTKYIYPLILTILRALKYKVDGSLKHKQ